MIPPGLSAAAQKIWEIAHPNDEAEPQVSIQEILKEHPELFEALDEYTRAATVHATNIEGKSQTRPANHALAKLIKPVKKPPPKPKK